MFAFISADVTAQVLTIVGAALVAGIGGSVSIYQVHTMGRRANQRDDYSALWNEVRLRDADADRLRDEVVTLFDQIKVLKEDNIALDGELVKARADALRLTDELIRYRAKAGENDIDN